MADIQSAAAPHLVPEVRTAPMILPREGEDIHDFLRNSITAAISRILDSICVEIFGENFREKTHREKIVESTEVIRSKLRGALSIALPVQLAINERTNEVVYMCFVSDAIGRILRDDSEEQKIAEKLRGLEVIIPFNLEGEDGGKLSRFFEKEHAQMRS